MKLLLFLSLTTLLPAHDYHISKTNLRYVAEREQVQIEMHLFVDDLEKDMAAYGAPTGLELGTKIEDERGEALLLRYLGRHFQVKWNGEDLPLEMVGYELEDDMHGFWVYLAADGVAAPESVTVRNSLLTEAFPDQKNIVKIYNGEERGATLLMSKQRQEGNYTR